MHFLRPDARNLQDAKNSNVSNPNSFWDSVAPEKKNIPGTLLSPMTNSPMRSTVRYSLFEGEIDSGGALNVPTLEEGDINIKSNNLYH